MPLNDPKQTGGMFLGRRPGTAPMRFHARPGQASPRRRAVDRVLAAILLGVEVTIALSLWGPVPLAVVWAGSYVEYFSGATELGLLASFLGMLLALLVGVAVMKRVDYAWKVVRRAAGYEQRDGALEWVFVVSLTVAVLVYLGYFLLLGDPGQVLG